MQPLYRLLDLEARRQERLKALVWVYALAAIIQLPNALLGYFLLPQMQSSRVGFWFLWGIALFLWFIFEVIKRRTYKPEQPLALVGVALWEGLSLASAAWLALFAARMGFAPWPLILLGLIAWGLGFWRLAARL